MYQKDIGGAEKKNEDAPTYAIVLSEQKGDILQGVKAGIYQEMGLGESYMRKPVIIYAEDATYYYGVMVAYDCTRTDSNNRGIYIYPGTFTKNPGPAQEGRLAEPHMTGWSFGSRHQLSMRDLGSLESYYGRVCGDYTDQLMFGGDPSMHASDILGVEFELNYEDAYELVNITAVFDFAGIGTDEAGLKATNRRVNIGSFSTKDLDKVFGLWGGDESWVNYIQAEVTGETPCVAGEHDYDDVIVREATCTYAGEVRHECTKCDYEYLSEIKAGKHDFTIMQGPLVEGDKGYYSDITFTCKKCGFSYVENQLVIVHLCNHKVTEVIQEQASTCENEGFKVYKCLASDCGEEWTEIIAALEHDYAITVVEPTDNVQGYTVYNCTKCGDTYMDNFVDEVVSNPIDSAKNNIIGIVAGSTYKTNETITFEAFGDQMNILPTAYARRYVPESWSVNPHGTWDENAQDYKASFSIGQAGDYLLRVVFRQQVYLNDKWYNTDIVSESKIAFIVAEEGQSASTPVPSPEETPVATPTAAPTSPTAPTKQG